MSDPLVLPVFPLEGVILFPRTMLPLHIFEPRYREMIEDLLEKPDDERLVVIANMEDQGLDQGMNPFAKVATVGKIVHLEKLEDGRSNIVLYGQFTVEVEEILPSKRSYRTGRIVNLREEFWEDPLSDHMDQKDRLLSSLYSFMERTNTRIENLEEVGLSDLINGLSFSLLQQQEKQELLEIQKSDQRLQRLIEILDNIGFYKEFVPDRDIYTGLN